jgi:hypothetical protein
MKKNKNPFSLTEINNTKALLRNILKGKKSIGALLYWILLPFLNEKKSKTKSRLQNLVYKVLKSFPITAVQFLRCYGRTTFKNDFKEWLELSPSQKSKKHINVRVDGSKTGRKYGFIIPELQWLYDYVTKSKMLTHEIYVLLISIGDKDYIVDFLLKKKSDKGTNKIAQNMLYNLYNSMGTLKSDYKQWVRISLDGAFGNGDMLKWLAKHNFINSALKSGGKDNCNFTWNNKIYRGTLKWLEGFLAKYGDFRTFNPCHKLSGEYVEIEVEISGIIVKVLLIRFKKKKKIGYRYLMILSLNLEWYAYQIFQTYKGRWPIETMFRTTKQRLDIEAYSFHSENTTENIEMHLALRFIGYMWLNWYRIENTRPSKTSLNDVVNRWKLYLNNLNSRAFQLLFSG